MNTRPFTDGLAMAESKGLVRQEAACFTVTTSGRSFLTDLLDSGVISAIPQHAVTQIALIVKFAKLWAGEHNHEPE
jgi:hypothetical protein